MRARRFLWQVGLGVFVALLAVGSAGGALAADPVNTAGGAATLRASDAVVKVTKRGNFRVTEANISTTDTEEFVGNGFAPGEVVSIFLTLPDGRVFPVVNTAYNDTPCCPQNDEVLADGTGDIYFQITFANFPSKTGSLTDGVRFTSTIFMLPGEFELASLPYGRYMVTAIGRVSLQKASTPVQLVPPGPPGILDGSTTTTGTLSVFTTIGHKTSARQVDPGLNPTGVVDNPNVDIACNGLIPGEFVSFWDTYPDGSAVTLSTIAADDGGSAIIQVELLTGKFPTGLHTFTCRGSQSNYYLTGAFLLLPGNIANQSSIGTLTVSYVGATQAVANSTFPQLPSFFASDYLLLTARNMRPNETVTFWQTFPDQTSHFLATVKANEAGAAVVVIQLFPGPVAYQRGKAVLGDAALYQIAYPAGVDGRIPTGRHYFSARGDTTARTATFPFDLLPSQVDP